MAEKAPPPPLPKMPGSSSSSSQKRVMPRRPMGRVLLGLGLFTAACASMPYYLSYRQKKHTLYSRTEGLTGSQVQRGPFTNAGSRDVGADPDYVEGEFKGEKTVFQGGGPGGARQHPTEKMPSVEEMKRMIQKLDAEERKAAGK
jgi:hypothetical protein